LEFLEDSDKGINSTFEDEACLHAFRFLSRFFRIFRIFVLSPAVMHATLLTNPAECLKIEGCFFLTCCFETVETSLSILPLGTVSCLVSDANSAAPLTEEGSRYRLSKGHFD